MSFDPFERKGAVSIRGKGLFVENSHVFRAAEHFHDQRSLMAKLVAEANRSGRRHSAARRVDLRPAENETVAGGAVMTRKLPIAHAEISVENQANPTLGTG